MAKVSKLSKSLKYFITVSVIAVVALIFVVTTSAISYNSTKKAIQDIGTVSFSVSSKEKIDLAQSKYDQFQEGLGASTTFSKVNKSVGEDELLKAKTVYAEAAIRDVNSKYLLGASEEDVVSELKTIRTTIDTYFANGDYSTISNYSTLTGLEAKFGSGASAESSEPQGSAEEPEIC